MLDRPEDRTFMAAELSGLMKALAHPDRIRIVKLLAAQGERNVSDMAARLNLSPTRISQHLTTLRVIGIVLDRPRGRQRVYSLVSSEIANWLAMGSTFIKKSTRADL